MRSDQVEPQARALRAPSDGSKRRSKPQSGAVAWIDGLIDWFIPPEIAAERETRQRARMFLISHICGPFIGNTIPLALFYFDPTPGYPVAVLAASITLFWAFPFRMMAIALGSANLVGFFLLEVFGPKVADDTPAFALQGLGIVSTVAASLYVTMMALYYAKILASGVDLEAEMRGHLATAEELRRATAESERAGLAKAEFVARMSHELRTPLNAVIGYSEILLENAEGEGDVADLEKIHASGKHLLRLVNEVLDLSKIEAGKMELIPETLDVARRSSS